MLVRKIPFLGLGEQDQPKYIYLYNITHQIVLSTLDLGKDIKIGLEYETYSQRVPLVQKSLSPRCVRVYGKQKHQVKAKETISH